MGRGTSIGEFTGRDVEYVHDGVTYVGYLAEPAGAAEAGSPGVPGVLVCHEGPGLTDHPRWRADRLADEFGCIAFALDYWGGGKALPADQVGAKLGPRIADPSTSRDIAMAGLAQLLAVPGVDPRRVAAIGYCFGGSMAIDLARAGAPIVAAVGFHSGLAHPQRADHRLRAKVLAMIGADDPIVSTEHRLAFEQEMSAAGVDWQLHVYGGAAHSFTNPNADRDGYRYHEPSDRRSWASMAELFGEVFGDVFGEVFT